MFGDRSVLMEEETGAGGGGGLGVYNPPVPGPSPSNRATNTGATFKRDPNSRGARMSEKAGAVTEAEDNQANEESYKAGQSSDTDNRSQKVVGGDRPAVPGGAGPGKVPWSAHATIQGGVSPDVAYGIAARDKRIHDAETLQYLTQMRASGATEQQQLTWAQINDQDAETARMVAEEHFPRMQSRIRELQQDVDDARSLKVDPYHWHESIGRGGRVAAAFAALTGGFAAGKNNPNSALKMMEAAIERDIGAQEQNIKNEFDALKMQKGLLGDERAMFDERLSAMQKIRATKYAGIVGRIQAAQQHAVTEAHHLSLQTAKDHFEMKLLQSVAAAQKEVLRLELDGPLRNGVQLAQYKAQIAEFTSQVAAGPAGNISVPTEKVSTLTGDTVGERPTAQIKMAAAPGRAAATASRSARTGTGSSSRTSVAKEPAEKILTPAERQPLTDEESGTSRLESQGEADERVRRDTAVKKGERTSKKNAGNAGRTAVAHPDIQAPQHVANNESFARTIAKAANESVVGITTWSQALTDIDGGRSIRSGGLTGTRDAEVVASLMAQNPPDPDMYHRGPDGKDSAAYTEAVRRHEYVQRFPEVLERPSSLNGERATITAGGRTYRVKAGARDEKTYAHLRDEIVKKQRIVGGLKEMASIIREKGLSGIFTDEGGLNLPGINTSDPGTMKMFNQAITQAMGFIKTHDPTARISDKDLEVGRDAAVPYLGKADKAIDFLQSLLDGNSQNNTKRKQIERFIGSLIVEANRIVWAEIENDAVPDWNALVEQGKYAEEMEKFTYQSKAK